MFRNALFVISILAFIGAGVLFYKSMGGMECQWELAERTTIEGEYLNDLMVIADISPFLLNCRSNCTVDSVAQHFSPTHHVYKNANGSGLEIDGVAVCFSKGSVSFMGPAFSILGGSFRGPPCKL